MIPKKYPASQNRVPEVLLRATPSARMVGLTIRHMTEDESLSFRERIRTAPAEQLFTISTFDEVAMLLVVDWC